MGANPGPVPPIFLLSCERAGSTLLRLILDTHPAVAAPGELGLGQLVHRTLVMLARTVGQTDPPRAGHDRAPVDPWWLGGYQPKSPAVQAVVAEARSMLGSVLERYATGCGKQIWCCKSPGDLPFAEVLHLLWPEARWLCLHRNALDVAHSCVEVSRYGFMEELAPYACIHPTNLWAAMLENWADKTEMVCQVEQRWPEFSYRLQYEQLVSRPKETLAGLWTFLELENPPGLLEEVFTRPHHRGGGDPKVWETSSIHTDGVGRRREFPRPVPAPLLQRVNELHKRLGYPRIVVV